MATTLSLKSLTHYALPKHATWKTWPTVLGATLNADETISLLLCYRCKEQSPSQAATASCSPPLSIRIERYWQPHDAGYTCFTYKARFNFLSCMHYVNQSHVVYTLNPKPLINHMLSTRISRCSFSTERQAWTADQVRAHHLPALCFCNNLNMHIRQRKRHSPQDEHSRKDNYKFRAKLCI